jgi:protein-disulfide isomerase
MRGSSLFIAATTTVALLVLFIYGLSALPPVNPETRPAGTETAASTLKEIDYPTVEFGDPTRGPADAAVTIVVFGDYLCAPCATLDGWLGQIMRAYPDDVRLVWKDLPHSTSRSTSGVAAAQAARCAAPYGAFWDYHDLLFADPQNLNSAAYLQLATQLGLDLQAFTDCLNSKATLPLVERDINEGLALHIDATPYVFVNKERSSGVDSYEALRQSVVTEIEKAPKKMPVFK